MADDRWPMADLWSLYEKQRGFVVDFSRLYHEIASYIKLYSAISHRSSAIERS